MDMEINLNFFKINRRPDIVILEKKDIGDDIGDHQNCLKGHGKMLYIIEVKKAGQKDSKTRSSDLIPGHSGRGRKTNSRSILF